MAITRNADDEEKQRDRITKGSLNIISMLAQADTTNSRLTKHLQNEAKKIVKLVQDRTREDRCWYCYSRRELGTETATGLTQCQSCAERT